MKKRILSLLLAMVMVFGMLPSFAFAAADSEPTMVTEENRAALGLAADFVGFYALADADDLFWFANHVNTNDRTASAVLVADIDLADREWTPIGSTGESSNNFRGVFDGQNHTIRGLNVQGGRAGLGFFGEVRTGTVRNFTIYGEVVANTEVNYVGGVIGSACGLNSTDHGLERNGAIIQNITSFVNVTAKAHGIGMIGGFVGYANHQSLIEKCAWYGTFDAGEYRVDSGAGGFVGRIYDTAKVTIRNCGAYGTVKTAYQSGTFNNQATIYIGGFLSYSPLGAETVLENNLWAGQIVNNTNLDKANAHLSAYGTMNSAARKTNCYALEGTPYVTTNDENAGGITTVTAEQLKSGEVAYKLGSAWGQTVGTDAYPVLGGEKVYEVKNCMGETAYSNTNEDLDHVAKNGFCTVCGKEVIDYFEISNADELYAFAEQVNAGNTILNGKLTADIVINENVLTDSGALNGSGSGLREWKSIRNYAGIFDGGGHTISGLYYKYSLFDDVEAAGKVQNVRIVDAFLISSNNFGGVVSGNYGSVTNCEFTGTITGDYWRVGGVVGSNYAGGTVTDCVYAGTVTGDVHVGGVVGYNDGGTVTGCRNSGAVTGSQYVGGVVGNNDGGTVTGCGNSGAVTGLHSVGGVAGRNKSAGTVTNCSNTGAVHSNKEAGGVVSSNGEGSTVTNCCNTGAVTSESTSQSYVGGVVTENSGSVANCYYDSTVFSGSAIGSDKSDGGVSADVLGKTTEQFKTGEVAYLLQGEQTEQLWGQTIGEEDYPVLGGAKVYGGYINCNERYYSNDPNTSQEQPAHDYDPDTGVCIYCGDVKPIDYDLWIGRKQVTSANAADVFGDGKVSYDAKNNILTLNNYTYSGAAYQEGSEGIQGAIFYSGLETLELVLVGESSIASGEDNGASTCGLYAAGDIIVSGTGSLTAIGGDVKSARSYGVYMGGDTFDSDITVNSGSLIAVGGTAVDGNSKAVFAGDITVNGGSLIATGGTADDESQGVKANNITVNGGTLTATGGTATEDTDNYALSHGVKANNITVNGGSLTARGGDAPGGDSRGVYLSTALNLDEDIIFLTPANGKFDAGQHAIVDAEGNIAKEVEIGEIPPTPYDLWVGGTQVTSANAADVFGDGTVSYDAEQKILTLNNYTYSGGPLLDGNVYAAIYYKGADTLELALVGENSVTHTGTDMGNIYGVRANGSITVSGTGSLTAAGGDVTDTAHWYHSYGVYTSSITVTGGSLFAVGGEGYDTYGVYAGSITVNSGSLTATGGAAQTQSHGLQVKGVTVNGGALTATGGTAVSSYGLSADSIEVTGGSLTATGGEGGISTGAFVEGKVTVSGGSLTAIGGTATSEDSLGMYAADSVNVTGGSLKVKAGDAPNGSSTGAKWYYMLNLGEGVAILNPVGGMLDTDRSAIVDAEGNIAKEVEIGVKTIQAYDVWVAGEQLTEEKLTVNGATGTATYDPETDTLTLNGFDNGEKTHFFTSIYGNPTYAAIYTQSDLNIVLEGETTLSVARVAEGYRVLLHSDAGLTISGTGLLAYGACNWTIGTATGLVINGGTVKVDGDTGFCGPVTLNGGHVVSYAYMPFDSDFTVNGGVAEFSTSDPGITYNFGKLILGAGMAAYDEEGNVIADPDFEKLQYALIKAAPCDHSGNENPDDGDCMTELRCSVCGEVVAAAKDHHTFDHTNADGYTNKGEYHTVSCLNCQIVQDGRHIYENGVCLCGAQEPLTAYRLVGTFNDWDTGNTTYELTKQADGTCTLTAIIPAGEQQFKVFKAGVDNLWYGLLEDASIVNGEPVMLNDDSEFNLKLSFTVPTEVTFILDSNTMTLTTAWKEGPAAGVYRLVGDFNDWVTGNTTHELTKQADGTYTLTAIIPAGEQQFKVVEPDVAWYGLLEDASIVNGEPVMLNDDSEFNLKLSFTAPTEVTFVFDPDKLTLTASWEEGPAADVYRLRIGSVESEMTQQADGTYALTKTIAKERYSLLLIKSGDEDFVYGATESLQIINGQSVALKAYDETAVIFLDLDEETEVTFVFDPDKLTLTASWYVPSAPAAATDLIASGGESIVPFYDWTELGWTDNADNETGYRILRTWNGETKTVAELAADSTSWTDSDMTGAGTYTYTVQAYNDRGTSDSAPVSVTFHTIRVDGCEASPIYAAAGTEVMVTANANPGWKVSRWVSEDVGFKLDGSRRANYFDMPASDVTVTAEFEVCYHTGEKLGHTPTEDGSVHTAVCSDCWETVFEDHTYENGVCRCGVTEPEPIEYGVCIGDTQFTSKNLTLTGGEGTAVYDPKTNTLTLENYTYSGDGRQGSSFCEGFSYTDSEVLKLVLVGENTITTTGKRALHATGDITVSGTGSLTMACSAEGQLAVNGAQFMSSSLTVDSGSLTILVTGTANSGSVGLRSLSGNVTVNGGSLTVQAPNTAAGASIGIQTDTLTVNGGVLTGIGGNADGLSRGINCTTAIITGGEVCGRTGTGEIGRVGFGASTFTLGEGMQILTPVGGVFSEDSHAILEADGATHAPEVKLGKRSAYTFQTSTQLYLKEPWAFRANVYVKNGETYLTEAELGQLDSGFWFIPAAALGDTVPTAEEIASHEKAVHMDATVAMGSNGQYKLSADYTEGIYTYQLDEVVYVVAYVDDGNGVQYTAVKSRNLLELAKNAAADEAFDETERAVYNRMVEMHTAITAHRATFASIPELQRVTAPYVTAGMFGEYKTDLTVKHSTQIVLIEPWGIKLNGYIDGDYTDYGLVISTKAGTLDELVQDTTARVYSVSGGTAEKSGTKISGLYTEEIYTYLLDQDLYVAFYAVDESGYHFGEVKCRNILDLVKNMAEDTAFSATERAVYEAMINMHTDVTTHRAKFGR